ncbi:MAG TPA: hypothetical protein VMM18_07425 [Gemmatimonadaceae bacterium]|nr:hypothetical protein [Gemmatimonadaceae bacterium]
MASVRGPEAPRASCAGSGARAACRLAALAVLCLNAWLLVAHHDRFWWPPDEGNYAHVAERILDGQVLHADVQDIHPGYVNFANAGALGLFGRELASMRYPLVVLGIAQSLLLFLILRPAGAAAAGVGASAITALGFLQFLNPTAHWYSLFLVVALAAVLHLAPRTARWRLDAVGAIVMTVVLFRQLSGVLLAMGALTWLLLEGSDRDGEPPVDRLMGRALIAIMIAGLIVYLVRATDAVGWMLFGIWPVLVLVQAARMARAPTAAVVAMLARLARGAAAAAVPLVGYHLIHGSIGAWYQDAIVTALAFPRLPFFETSSYAQLIAAGVRSVASGDPLAIINGAYWALLPLAGAAAGAVLLARLARARAGDAPSAPPALAVIAVFYAVVSVHYQIPPYLAYTVGLSVAALIVLSGGSRAVTGAAAAFAIVAVVFHAGQPLSRGIEGATAGRRVAVVASESVPGVGLRIEAGEVELYRALVELVRREVPPDQPILAVPSHAQLYFLTGRRNPFRFFNTALGVSGERELEAVLEELDRHPPALVFYDRRDKYNTPQSRAIMERVARTYARLTPLGPFEIYRRPPDALATPVAARGATPSSME